MVWPSGLGDRRDICGRQAIVRRRRHRLSAVLQTLSVIRICRLRLTGSAMTRISSAIALHHIGGARQLVIMALPLRGATMSSRLASSTPAASRSRFRLEADWSG